MLKRTRGLRSWNSSVGIVLLVAAGLWSGCGKTIRIDSCVEPTERAAHRWKLLCSQYPNGNEIYPHNSAMCAWLDDLARACEWQADE